MHGLTTDEEPDSRYYETAIAVERDDGARKVAAFTPYVTGDCLSNLMRSVEVTFDLSMYSPRVRAFEAGGIALDRFLSRKRQTNTGN